MKLPHDIHLGYCTNIHRGESWEETFAGLRDYTMRVREQIAPDQPYGIGLRLGHAAAVELSQKEALLDFQRWLEKNDSYVFTINGFPYGQFHNTRVKQDVYRPDWTTPERLEYTNLLFDLLVEMLPADTPGSVSTLPGSFKEFGIDADGLEAIFGNLEHCRRHIEALREKSGQDLHLGLEPEPLGLFETSGESLKFFGHLVERSGPEILETIGLNYDTCHLAVEFEEAGTALERLSGAGIRISKLHLSSALKCAPTPENRARLAAFGDDVYLHQVVVREGEGASELPLRRILDLPEALAMAEAGDLGGDEWRIHFHVPLHAGPDGDFGTTQDHLLGALDWLSAHPSKCQHLEMETYTWEVLPSDLRASDVVDQLAREYHWALSAMRDRGLA